MGGVSGRREVVIVSIGRSIDGMVESWGDVVGGWSHHLGGGNCHERLSRSSSTGGCFAT